MSLWGNRKPQAAHCVKHGPNCICRLGAANEAAHCPVKHGPYAAHAGWLQRTRLRERLPLHQPVSGMRMSSTCRGEHVCLCPKVLTGALKQ